jgi:hypothetical protein
LLKFRGITVAFAAVVAFGAASIPISAAALVGAAAEGGPGWDDGGRDVWQVVDQNTPRPSSLNRLSPRQIKPPGRWHGWNVWRVRAPLSSVSSGGGARLKLRCSAWRTVRDGGSLLGINPGHELLVGGHVDLEAAINRGITVAEMTIRRPRSLSIVMCERIPRWMGLEWGREQLAAPGRQPLSASPPRGHQRAATAKRWGKPRSHPSHLSPESLTAKLPAVSQH